MRDFAANDIHLLADINLYLTPKDRNGVRVLHGPDGAPIRDLRWPERGGSPRGRKGAFFPTRSTLEGISGVHANWRGGDLGYLRAKWELSIEELAALLGVAPGRALTLLASPAATLTPEEGFRLAILLHINAGLLELVHPEGTSRWLRSNATMTAFEGGSPLEQLVIWGIAAMDRMHRALSRHVGGDYPWLERQGLSQGFDWVVDLDGDDGAR
jgi:hypothetical protein